MLQFRAVSPTTQPPMEAPPLPPPPQHTHHSTNNTSRQHKGLGSPFMCTKTPESMQMLQKQGNSLAPFCIGVKTKLD